MATTFETISKVVWSDMSKERPVDIEYNNQCEGVGVILYYKTNSLSN